MNFCFQACIIYQMSNGTVVYQHGIHWISASCRENNEKLGKIIKNSFNMSGKALCCRAHGCNDRIPDESKHVSKEIGKPQLNHLKQASSSTISRIPGIKLLIFCSFVVCLKMTSLFPFPDFLSG